MYLPNRAVVSVKRLRTPEPTAAAVRPSRQTARSPVRACHGDSTQHHGHFSKITARCCNSTGTLDLARISDDESQVAICFGRTRPGINDAKMSAFYQTLHDDLCKLGAEHYPAMLFAKGESHMSQLFSIDTADTSVSGPILKWIKGVCS